MPIFHQSPLYADRITDYQKHRSVSIRRIIFSHIDDYLKENKDILLDQYAVEK